MSSILTFVFAIFFSASVYAGVLVKTTVPNITDVSQDQFRWVIEPRFVEEMRYFELSDSTESGFGAATIQQYRCVSEQGSQDICSRKEPLGGPVPFSFVCAKDTRR